MRQATPAGLELHPQVDRSVEHDGRADQLPAPGGRIVTQNGPGAQRQRVGDRHQPGRAPQLGDEDRGIRLVVLTSLEQLVGRDREGATSLVVEQAAEQRLGVEARQAEPWDAAVETNQRRCRPVTDQRHVLERQIAVAPVHRAKRGLSVEHARAL